MHTPDSTQTLALIGLSISTWQQAERALTELFAIVSDMPPRKAIPLFDAIINFKIRLQLLDSLMEQEGLSPLDKELWTRMSSTLREAYKKRHKLAHFGLVGTKDGLGISPFLTFGKSFDPNRETLTPRDIKQAQEEFVELALSVEWFIAQAVHRRPQSQIGLLRPVSEQPLIARLRDQAAQRLAKRKHRAEHHPATGEPPEGESR